jgi:hypothetical protein
MQGGVLVLEKGKFTMKKNYVNFGMEDKIDLLSDLLSILSSIPKFTFQILIKSILV